MDASEFTNSDLPEPLGPEIRTPPIVGSMALIMRAVFAVSCPTIAVKGYLGWEPGEAFKSELKLYS
jgi:hypothetical protein